MKTDALFYELFKLDPASLFRLIQLNISGRYSFESITVKTTEKRFDGFFQRMDGRGPNIFLEVQGYSGDKIFWRIFREIFAWYEQDDSDEPFFAVVLFIDMKYNPDNCPVSCVPPNRLICIDLVECLKSVEDDPGVLTVLKPFMLPDAGNLRDSVRQWKMELDSLNLPGDRIKIVTELLEYTILQRFPKLTLKEIQKMIELTPLEQTVAGQELVRMGMTEGKKEGELIGKIRLAQRILRRPVMLKKDLEKMGIRQLKKLCKELETDLMI